MRILVSGATGFVGSAVVDALSRTHEVHKLAASKQPEGDLLFHNVDLLDTEKLNSLVTDIKPEVILQCAGIVENSDRARLNIDFTRNMIRAAVVAGSKPRIIICGSAAEYGVVSEGDLPVGEETPLNANSKYGESKKAETRTALELGEEYDLDIVIARIFNPIGSGMHPRFLIPNVVKQIRESQDSKVILEISRKDARRDYIDLVDVASALKCIAEAETHQYDTYNVGSGTSTSNEELVNLIADLVTGGDRSAVLTETSPEPEKLIAVQADITRMSDEFNWKPEHSLETTVREIAKND